MAQNGTAFFDNKKLGSADKIDISGSQELACQNARSCVRGETVRGTVSGPPIAKQFGVFEPLIAQKRWTSIWMSTFFLTVR